jgi:squalene-hopene/tetraprenyl-beta-curcumene cyclase
VSENPGIGQEGFYYYLLVFAKAHGVFGEPVVVTPDGKTHDWRLDLIRQLLNTQRADGSWANANGRWMENMPELVTAYSLTAMRLALGRQFRDAVPALGAK